ncbi:MAG: hypothetical protein R8M14_07030 [Ghiorsea sp.]
MKTSTIFLTMLLLSLVGCGGGGGGTATPTAIVGTDHRGSFEFGIAPQDWWGPVCGLPGCTGLENNKNEIAQLMTGVSRANGSQRSLLVINDFHKAMAGYTIGTHTGTGADTLTQAELLDLVTQAHAIGQSNIVLTTYLYTLDPAVDAAYRGLWTTTNINDVKLHLASLKTLMISEAQRAEKAGVDGLVILPGNYHLGLQGVLYSDLKSELQAIVNAAKKNFTGKIYLRGELPTLLGISDFVFGVDAFLLEHTIESIFSSIPPSDNNNLVALKDTWKTYLTTGIWNFDINELYAKGDVYIWILVPSYRGALQGGWVEPAAAYPAGTYTVDEALQSNVYEALFQTINEMPSIPMKGVISYGFWWIDSMYPNVWQRNDISHSIRNKQAETVFSNWSKLIQ